MFRLICGRVHWTWTLSSSYSKTFVSDRPHKYDKSPFSENYSLQSVSNTFVFVAENAVYVWTGGAKKDKKIAVFENIRIRVEGALVLDFRKWWRHLQRKNPWVAPSPNPAILTYFSRHEQGVLVEAYLKTSAFLDLKTPKLFSRTFKDHKRSGCVDRQQFRSIDRNLFFFKPKVLIFRRWWQLWMKTTTIKER